MLKQIIISFLLISWSQSLSTLTTANCPTDFAASAYNSSLALASKNLADSIYGNLFSQ
jgi:hypothetical protein